METETIFRIILPMLIISFAAHRGYYVKNHSKPEDATVKQREEGIVSKLAGLLGMVGFISMIAYVINPNWLALAVCHFPHGCDGQVLASRLQDLPCFNGRRSLLPIAGATHRA